MSNRQYLSCAETAKLVRAALKESFPGVKFSVKSSVYSGGASIAIRYFDGPNSDQVKAVTSMFEGSYFDGMTDYKGSNYSTLDGQEVRFGADFIFINREYSAEYLTSEVAAACAYFGYPMPQITKPESYGAYIADCLDYEITNRIYSKTCKASLCASSPSSTLARVGFLGDDGYGYGAVGRLAA